MADERVLGEIRSQLADTLAELQTISQRLNEFDHTVSAVNLRAELSGLRRYLDTLSDTLAIVVQHLLPVPNANPSYLQLEQDVWRRNRPRSASA